MKRKIIYLVMAHTDYEGSDPVLAFEDERAARAFIQKCDEHEKNKPHAPNVIDDTPENDAMHEAFWKKRDKWASRHPAGKDNAGCDRFCVYSIELTPNDGGKRSDD